jgi:cytochrome bd-type quinol oxidase subunit 1
VYTLRENKRRGENESTTAMVFACHVTTIVAIVIICVICFFLLSIMIPGYLSAGDAEKHLMQKPDNIITDKTGGLSFNVWMSATIVNFAVGSFTGIILPFSSKQNQTRDDRDPTPFHQRRAR